MTNNEIDQELINLRVKFDQTSDPAERQDLWQQIINLENQKMTNNLNLK